MWSGSVVHLVGSDWGVRSLPHPPDLVHLGGDYLAPLRTWSPQVRTGRKAAMDTVSFFQKELCNFPI